MKVFIETVKELFMDKEWRGTMFVVLLAWIATVGMTVSLIRLIP